MGIPISKEGKLAKAYEQVNYISLGATSIYKDIVAFMKSTKERVTLADINDGIGRYRLTEEGQVHRTVADAVDKLCKGIGHLFREEIKVSREEYHLPIYLRDIPDETLAMMAIWKDEIPSSFITGQMTPQENWSKDLPAEVWHGLVYICEKIVIAPAHFCITKVDLAKRLHINADQASLVCNTLVDRFPESFHLIRGGGGCPIILCIHRGMYGLNKQDANKSLRDRIDAIFRDQLTNYHLKFTDSDPYFDQALKDWEATGLTDEVERAISRGVDSNNGEGIHALIKDFIDLTVIPQHKDWLVHHKPGADVSFNDNPVQGGLGQKLHHEFMDQLPAWADDNDAPEEFVDEMIAQWTDAYIWKAQVLAERNFGPVAHMKPSDVDATVKWFIESHVATRFKERLGYDPTTDAVPADKLEFYLNTIHRRMFESDPYGWTKDKDFVRIECEYWTIARTKKMELLKSTTVLATDQGDMIPVADIEAAMQEYQDYDLLNRWNLYQDFEGDQFNGIQIHEWRNPEVLKDKLERKAGDEKFWSPNILRMDLPGVFGDQHKLDKQLDEWHNKMLKSHPYGFLNEISFAQSEDVYWRACGREMVRGQLLPVGQNLPVRISTEDMAKAIEHYINLDVTQRWNQYKTMVMTGQMVSGSVNRHLHKTILERDIMPILLNNPLAKVLPVAGEKIITVEIPYQ